MDFYSAKHNLSTTMYLIRKGFDKVVEEKDFGKKMFKTSSQMCWLEIPENVILDVDYFKQLQKKAEPAKAVKSPSEKTPVQEVQAVAETADSVAGTPVKATNDAVPTDNLPASPPQVQPERVVELNTLEVVKKVLPDYSSFSRKRKEEGTVKIIATVTDGRVVSAEVESSSGYPRLDESAVRAVRQWLFKNKGTVRVRVPVVFRLK